MRAALNREVEQRLAAGGGMWLFLDYDGTLAEFAPTPEVVAPNLEVIDLLTQLAKSERTRVTILSGRRMAHIHKLLPVPGVILAGTYGLEIEHPVEGPTVRIDLSLIRPVLDEIKLLWMQLIRRAPGFFLEDKGLALALHARFAPEADAARLMPAARRILDAAHLKPELFRIVAGNRFLEIGPAQAGKGMSVEYLVARYAWSGAFCVFVGDDDRDEEAFQVIRKRGGVTVLAAAEDRPTHAEFRLSGPPEVRAWLGDVLLLLERIPVVR